MNNLDFETSTPPGPTGSSWFGWGGDDNTFSQIVVADPANGGNQYVATRMVATSGFHFMENNAGNLGNAAVANMTWYYGAWIFYDANASGAGGPNDVNTDQVKLFFRADNSGWNTLTATETLTVAASSLTSGQWNYVEGDLAVGDPEPPAGQTRIDNVKLQLPVNDSDTGVFYLDNLWLDTTSGVGSAAPPLPTVVPEPGSLPLLITDTSYAGPGNDFIIDFTGAADTTYNVESSPDLQVAFVPIVGVTALTNGSGVGTATVPAADVGSGKDFFRMADIPE